MPKRIFNSFSLTKNPTFICRLEDLMGEVIHTTKDKVRYEAERTKEFIVIIPKSLLTQKENKK